MIKQPPAFLPQSTPDGMVFKEVHGKYDGTPPLWHLHGDYGVVMVFVSCGHPRDAVVTAINKVLEEL